MVVFTGPRRGPRAGPRVAAWLLASVAFAVAALPAHAQYFGRNKVQYETFDFKVLKTEHFDVYYYPREAAAAAAAARMAERWRTRLGRVFDHQLSGRQPLILYASGPQFQQTNAVGGAIGEGTGGVTEALRRRIVLPIGGTLGDLNHVVGHELVHAFQYDITGEGRPGGLGRLPAASQLPLWFIEGMAEYLSLGPVDPNTAMWMRGAIADTGRDSLPTFGQLNDPRFFPYRYGQALLAWVAGHWGDAAMGRLLRNAARRRGVDQAIRSTLGLTPDDLVRRWHQETRAFYQPFMEGTRPPGEFGPRILQAQGGDRGRYNLAPTLSPDGRRLMFLSDRELFSIDLFLADARTGKVQRQITRTALDPHLESLQFIESAGSWSPDGRRFVFAGISSGRPVLELYDVERGRVAREVRLAGLGEVLNPTWAPDGRSLAFAGIVGGLSDLFVYDLETDSLRRLTRDRYADLQPAWSPDGRTLAFATDRYTTDLRTLDIGPYQLALLDLASGRITRVPATGSGKQLNPQWSPDGRSLYFLADPNGISDIYRVELNGGPAVPITNLFTGVAGITATSPALSVAQRSGRLVYSVYQSNGYDVYAINDPAAAGRGPVAVAADGEAAGGAAALPPVERVHAAMPALLSNATTGLPAETAFPTRPYDADLSLTYIGQPSLIAGSSQFGTFVGGGASLYFSDILGNHNLITGLQVQGGLKDITALVGYQNLRRRINWGLAAQQIPYLAGGYAEGTTTINGEPVLVQQQLIERQTNRDFIGQLSYPFSQVFRVEASAGYTNITFDRELQTRGFSLISGAQVVDQNQDLDAPGSLNLAVASAALVFDNSFFGATSPILGQRYRLEVTPTAGSIAYLGVLADYRRYFMPFRPFTLATRLLHYGRYGRGGESGRLQPIFLGYPGLVRGYGYGSFDVGECAPPPDQPDACPVFDQLLGSRIAVANLELRFPLLGVLGLGSGYYGAFPIELAAFADAGLAWDTANDPRVFGLDGTREPVTSAGVALRVNLLGFAVGEVDLVRPFDRPGRGWVWQFQLQPGF